MDPYRYLPFIYRKVMQAWAERELPPQHESWTPMTKPHILDATELTQVTAPELAQALLDDQVDLVLLVPV